LKIAVTADLHLTTISKNPERFHALSDILQQCGTEKVQLLVIAGDLFDKNMPNYADFEQVYKKNRPKGLRTVVIPGNHDHTLSSAQIIGEGLFIYDQPILQPLNDTRKILFLPYQADRSMGEAIAPFADELHGERWTLIGHGDWTDSFNTPDPYESGFYMPLTRNDLVLYQPELVFLGHIHLPQGKDKIYYPGSPTPLNINETGPRRFLVLDTEVGEVRSLTINSVLEYYNEHFVMIPGDNDLDHLIQEIQERIQGWELSPSREEYVQVRVEISGNALTDRIKIQKGVKKAFSPYHFYLDQDPILQNLFHDSDPDRAAVAQEFKSWLQNLDWNNGIKKPTKTLILEKALNTVYGVDE